MAQQIGRLLPLALLEQLADRLAGLAGRPAGAGGGGGRVAGEGVNPLDRVCVNSGTTTSSTAVSRGKKGDEVCERAAASDGPVNAAFRAINKIVGKEIELEDYSLRSMTDGEDAQAEAIAKVSIDGGEMVTGRGVSTDVIEASIKAYINGINKYFID